MTLIYKPVFETLSEAVNSSQSFSPFFSWIAVCFTYFAIAVNGGTIWRYLFYVTTLDFLASFLATCYNVSNNLNTGTKFFISLTWVEGLCWALSEWGYVYLNFVKIKSCIKLLQKKYWKVIMGLLLVYCIGFRSRLSYLDYQYRSFGKDFMSFEDISNEKDKNYVFLFFPLGLICAIFIIINIIELYIENDKDKDTHTNNLVLLRSNLSRMLLVAIVFIGYMGLGIIVRFKALGLTKFNRELLWKIKGNFGLIFLIDLLLLRIDLDQNHINKKDNEIKRISINNSLDGSSNDGSYDYGEFHERSSIEFTSELLSNRSVHSIQTAHSYNTLPNISSASSFSGSNLGRRYSNISIERRMANSINNPRSSIRNSKRYYSIYSKNPLFSHSKVYMIPKNTQSSNLGSSSSSIIFPEHDITHQTQILDLSKKNPYGTIWESKLEP